MTLHIRPFPSIHWRLCTLFALLALLLTSNLGAQSREPQINLPRVALTAGMYRIDAQVARAPLERQIGLMYRKSMPAHEGMLFVFEEPGVQCFWMKNTLLELTAAFVADDGTVVNLVDMKPQSTDSHCSEEPVRFVLEMNKGWFQSRAMKAGSKLSGSVFAQKPSSK